MTKTPTEHEHKVQLHGIRNGATHNYWVLRSPDTNANGDMGEDNA